MTKNELVQSLNLELENLYKLRSKNEDSYMQSKIYEDCVEIITNKKGMLFLMSEATNLGWRESYLTSERYIVSLWLRTPNERFFSESFEGLGFNLDLEWTGAIDNFN